MTPIKSLQVMYPTSHELLVTNYQLYGTSQERSRYESDIKRKGNGVCDNKHGCLDIGDGCNARTLHGHRPQGLIGYWQDGLSWESGH
jgi:hypothetical protein